VAAVEYLARSDQRLAASVDQWDRDPWLLNTPAGTVNLKTGATHGHRPEDYITKVAATSPGGKCDLWRKFIETVAGGDTDLAGFIQRMLGYSLTGSTREQCLFFLYGLGANGKSVLLNTVSSILADYHATAPIETFTASVTDRHPTDLAGLRGARVVTAIETEEGRRWAEAKIKSLTGGDPIPARFMRQDFFTFTPQFKLIVAGNHKPSLRTVDKAIRRRFHLVPCTVTIPGRMARHPAMDDRRLPHLAKPRPQPSRRSPRGDRNVPRGRGRHRRLDHGLLRPRSQCMVEFHSAVRLMVCMGHQDRREHRLAKNLQPEVREPGRGHETLHQCRQRLLRPPH
jgi:putative DNA primase/helicase